METGCVLGLGGVELEVREGNQPLGTRVLAGLVKMAETAVERLHRVRSANPAKAPAAVLSRLRGTGRGVSSSRLFAELEQSHPISLEYPFEGSDRVGGAVWIARDLLGGTSEASVAKLCWDSRAMDLPMHVHDHSDRFIIVLKGRGFFHITDESAEEFTGTKVRSVPARERDVFLFSRGAVHTFSTDAEPMILLSCQLPFLSFDDPRQYRLPKVRWTAKDHQDPYRPQVACDPAWSVLASRPSPQKAPSTGEPKPISLADVLTMGP